MSSLENQKTLPLPEDAGKTSPLSAMRESLKNPHVRLAIWTLGATALAITYQAITAPTNEIPKGTSITEATAEDITFEKNIADMIGIDIAGFNFIDTNDQPVTVSCHYNTMPAAGMTFDDILKQSTESVYPPTYDIVPKETVEVIALEINKETTQEGRMAVIHSCGAKPQSTAVPY